MNREGTLPGEPRLPDESSRKTGLSRTMTWLGRIVSLVCIVFLVGTLLRYRQDLPAIRSDGRALAAGATVILFGVLSVGLNALTWQRLIRKLQPVSWRQAVSITGRSQIAKYLPGNVFHYLGKVILARQVGLRTPVVVLSMLIETAIAVATGGAIGLLGFGLAAQEYRTLSIVLLAALLCSPLAWPFLKSRFQVVHDAIDRIGILNLLQAVTCQAINFGLFGTSAFLLARGMWSEPLPLGWWELTWGCALAWIVGFITPGAPGGVGVREGLLVVIFSGQIGTGSAAALFLVLRFAQVASDGLAFAIAALINRDRSQS